MTINDWELDLLIEACEHAVVPSDYIIEQIVKSQVFKGSVKKALAAFVSI